MYGGTLRGPVAVHARAVSAVSTYFYYMELAKTKWSPIFGFNRFGICELLIWGA